MAATDDDRFTLATPWNQQPALWVLTSLFATWCLLALVARVCIRRKSWLMADSVHAVSFALAVGSWIAMFVALDHGAGKSPSRLTSRDYNAAGEAVFASIIFLVLAKGIATASHLLLLNHMLAMPNYIKLCERMIGLCLLVYVGVCLAVSVRCVPENALSTKADSSCSGGVTRWSLAYALIASQIAIATVLPAVAFWNIQKPLQTRLNIISWFTIPPFIDILPMSLTLWQYTTSIASSPSGTGLVPFLACLHSSLCWNLLYPVIPALRPTALSYATTGAALSPEGTAALGSQGYGSRGYGSHMSRSGTGRNFSTTKPLEIDEMPLRPLKSREGNHTSIGAGSNNEEDGVDSTRGPLDPRTIQIKHEFEIVDR